MMAVEEGSKLMFDGQDPSDIVDVCINNLTDRKVWLLSICLALGNAADAVEIICVGYIMTAMGDMITTSDKEYLTSAVFIGMLFGGLSCGYLSDVIGRKPALSYSLGLNAIAGLASAFVPNVTWLIILRVIGGLGIGGSVPSVFSMGAEIFPCAIRGKQLSIVASFWMMGALYAALTGWIMLGDDLQGQRIMPGANWRWYAAVSALPAIAALIATIFILPESPRFLMHKKKYRAAARSLKYLSGVDVDSSTLTTIARPSQTAEQYPQDRKSIDSHIGQENKTVPVPQTSTIFLLFGPSLVKVTVTLMIIWFSLSFGSYGISTWISTLFVDIGITNAFADSFIFALANFPGNAVSFLFIERVGRRKLLSMGMVSAAVSSVGFALGTRSPAVVVLCASLFNAFSTAGWNSLDCMSVESFPTEVRTSAMGILAAAGRIGAVAAQFVNGSLENNIALLLFVTSGFMILGGLSAWALPKDNTGTKLDVDEPCDDSSSSSSSSSTSGGGGGGGGGGGDDSPKETSGASGAMGLSKRSSRNSSGYTGYTTISDTDNTILDRSSIEG